MSPLSVRRVAERAALVLLSLPDDLHAFARRREILFFPKDCVYDASPVDAPQPTMNTLNSCFDARDEYGAIGAVSTFDWMPMRVSICATAWMIFSSLT